MQTLLPDCSVRKLQPVNADIEKIYAMASQNTLFYQYHPPFVTWQSILNDMSALPPGKTMADKFYIGFFNGAALAAVVDMIRSGQKTVMLFVAPKSLTIFPLISPCKKN